MESYEQQLKQKLPGDPLSLILGILSIPLCCCYGVPGVILGVIGMVTANKSQKLFNDNPGMYDAKSMSNVKTGRILSIVGIVLGAIYLAIVIFMLATGQYDGYMEQYREMLEQ